MPDHRLTLPGLVAKKRAGERIVMLTCYDALFAKLLEPCCTCDTNNQKTQKDPAGQDQRRGWFSI